MVLISWWLHSMALPRRAVGQCLRQVEREICCHLKSHSATMEDILQTLELQLLRRKMEHHKSVSLFSIYRFWVFTKNLFYLANNVQSYITRVSPTTIQWLIQNYETAEGVSLPRSTLYSHYQRHCAETKQEPVNAASFGKLIRSVFLGLRTRRIGTRGNSKYHYYGIRVKPTSILNQIEDPTGQQQAGQAAHYNGLQSPGVNYQTYKPMHVRSLKFLNFACVQRIFRRLWAKRKWICRL